LGFSTEWYFAGEIMRHIVKFALAAVALVPLSARANDVIPYGTPGTQNATPYTFTAASTGDIVAYFWDHSGASFENVLGLAVNGVLRGSFGLDNQTSNPGDSFDFGSVNAGDTLVFVMRNLHQSYADQTPPLSPADVFSDASLNGPYDHLGAGAGDNHVYSTAYTATSPTSDHIPVGTYVGFEDLPDYMSPDWNYTDEQFVFTNVASSAAAPLPSTAFVGSVLLGGLWLRRRANHRVPV
jgi:hypothetical protein